MGCLSNQIYDLISRENMEVQIMCRETIKPWWPTPDYLRSYKLCLIDQLVPPMYISIVLFYSARSRDGGPKNTTSDSLKKSLSKALAHFYPLAGRLKDDLTIDCNDSGATFIEAQADCDMSFVVQDVTNDGYMQQLLPLNPLLQLSTTPQIQSGSDQVMLAVQVNYFACGGMAIGVCISHVIADASAAANFLKTWAEIAASVSITSADQYHNTSIEGVIHDRSSLFPPRNVSNYYKVVGVLMQNNNMVELQTQSPQDGVVTQRFLFEASKIAALRNEIRDEFESWWTLTRIEAVTALIWEAIIAATAENVGISPILGISNSVNFRKRMNPPLPPQQCTIGNACCAASIFSGLEDIERIKNCRSSLARKIHESIKKIDDDYIRKMFTAGPDDECFDKLIEKTGEVLEKYSKTGVFCFSSWCRFPFYETDFGWGKPILFRNGIGVNRNGFFLDTSDGEGIEAWISLTKQEMAKLEQQPGVLAYATFKPSTGSF